MKNFDKLIYTYKHRKVLFKLAEKYYNNDELLKQLKTHDLDKMYLLLFYEKKDIEDIHRSLARHHDNNLSKTKIDYIEMILDWESARYTKPDKPLNAYDTLMKFYPNLIDTILPILKELKLDYSTTEMEQDIMEYVSSISDVSKQDIKNELTNFISNIQ